MTSHAGTTSHGTFRIADGSPVEFATALEAWIPLAYDELIATARVYRAVTTYGELTERIQLDSGIRTRSLIVNWAGRLLEEVAKKAKAAGEPPLTSLCVHQNGTIGPGYARAPKSTDDSPGEDIEYYAAKHRLLCYQKYAEDLPADGGQPALIREESDRRRSKAAQARREAPRAVCASCNTELPAHGRCDYCD